MAILDNLADKPKFLQSKTAVALVLVAVFVPIATLATNSAWILFCVLLGVGLAVEYYGCCKVNACYSLTWSWRQLFAAECLFALIPLGLVGAIFIRELPYGVACLMLIAVVVSVTDAAAQIIG